MNKKGFILIEVLMGLTLLAIVTITCLPILNTALNNLMLAKEKTKMIFIAESIIEEIKSFDYNLTDEGECLLDIEFVELINQLNNETLVTIKLPLDVESKKYKYVCTINKESKLEDLWKIQVEVSLHEDRGKIKNVNIISYIPRPIKSTNIKGN